MTNEEFSNEFDTLVNSNSASLPLLTPLGFDEYEKSVFLTKAQESVVISLYKGTLTGDSFEKTEELRRYLDSLVKTYSTNAQVVGKVLTSNSYLFSLPKDTWFITYEAVESKDKRLGCAKGSIMEVVPVSQDELYKTLRNPFRMPNERRVLRLDAGGNTVELISVYNIDKYWIRYLSKPDPIILIDLPEGITINGESKATECKCKLNPAIHRVILEMAVSLALKSRANAGE
jgi:hypothetical protein